jgi:hypothetical protein
MKKKLFLIIALAASAGCASSPGSRERAADKDGLTFILSAYSDPQGTMGRDVLVVAACSSFFMENDRWPRAFDELKTTLAEMNGRKELPDYSVDLQPLAGTESLLLRIRQKTDAGEVYKEIRVDRPEKAEDQQTRFKGEYIKPFPSPIVINASL